MTKETAQDAVEMLRQYAENRWFSGENAVTSLQAMQAEELTEAETPAEREDIRKGHVKHNQFVMDKFVRQYHEIHDLIKRIEAENV